MKNITRFIFYTLFCIFITSFSAFADIQEEIRNYIRNWHGHIGNKAEIARQLGVSKGCLDPFIKENSTTNSPTIVNNFRDRFPLQYQNFMEAIKSTTPVLSSLTTVVPMLPVKVAPERPRKLLFSFQLPEYISFVVAHPLSGPLAVTPLSLTDAHVQAGVQAFHELPPLFLPRLSLAATYVIDLNGHLILRTIGPSLTPFEIRVFGPDSHGRFGWITRGKDPLECFAYAIKSDEPRLGLPVEYEEESGADGSHLLDRFHTPYPKSLFNSNKDPVNFVAEEPILNRDMRKSLTQDMGYSAYRQLYIRDKDAPVLSQRQRFEFHKAKNRWSTFEDGEITVAPTSSIFLGLRQNFSGPSPSYEGRVYYLPENNLTPGRSLYEHCYHEAKKHDKNAKYKSHVVPQFEVQNAAYLFTPLIFNERQTPTERKIEFYRTFYTGINLFPFASFNETLAFLNDLGLPFSWNGVRGYTKEQIQRLTHQIHTAALTGNTPKLDEDLKPRQPHWNNFRLPSRADSGRLEWEDAEDRLIPSFPKILTAHDIVKFKKYVSAFLLEQAIKSPLATPKLRLRLAENCIKENDFEKAGELLQLAFQQIDREGTLNEGLELLRLYAEFLSKTGQGDQLDEHPSVISTRALIERKRGHAPLEELIKVKNFNQKMAGTLLPLEDKLGGVKKITSDNCQTIKNKNMLPEGVAQLKEILSIVPSIEEFSLEDIVLSTRDYWVTVAWTEDDSIEDHVSPQEYFWTYAAPLPGIIDVLKKHQASLKKLNLRNLAFGLYIEDEKRINCWFDAANILRTLSSIHLPELEELHISGILKSSDEDSIQLFENLPHQFPKLQKVYLSLDTQTEEHELTPDILPKVARVFRGIRDDEIVK
jgi:hypothetical protein